MLCWPARLSLMHVAPLLLQHWFSLSDGSPPRETCGRRSSEGKGSSSNRTLLTLCASQLFAHSSTGPVRVSDRIVLLSASFPPSHSVLNPLRFSVRPVPSLQPLSQLQVALPVGISCSLSAAGRPLIALSVGRVLLLASMPRSLPRSPPMPWPPQRQLS